jgi:hypothetical protein
MVVVPSAGPRAAWMQVERSSTPCCFKTVSNRANVLAEGSIAISRNAGRACSLYSENTPMLPPASTISRSVGRTG